MAKEVRLPQLGQTMEEGTVVNCLIKVGDEVKKGDVIFEIETDKATLEMESPADGFVKHILAKVDETLPVGAPVLVLGAKDEDVPQSFVDSLTGAAPAPAEVAPAAEAPPVAEPAKSEPEPAKPAGRIMASPRVKKLAADLGVDLAKVAGTGPAGKITEQDIQNAAAAKPSKPAAPAAPAAEAKAGQTIPLNRLQRITAEKMLKSKQEIPCFYLTVKADVTNLVELRTKLNETGNVKLSYNDFILKAIATGLEKYPIMTGQLAGDQIKLAESIGIGLAISVPDGLVAPIVKDVNKKDVRQIAIDSQALVERARSNKLAPTDVEGGCITVSNLGAFGIDNFIPIVVPGQCSILGIGQITDTCAPNNGNILVRKLMNMTLSVDHKIANGAYAAKFLDFVRKQLEDTSTFGL
ncbi:MAG: 2-oxo acid dehydrogenase subunit E2 [Sedimentisphaerales bacterium]|nr:2-oxo acid dehydrogenase subunit E2 [Sedimentisphaerales bacterium]